jgi:hypothetical protein
VAQPELQGRGALDAGLQWPPERSVVDHIEYML